MFDKGYKAKKLFFTVDPKEKDLAKIIKLILKSPQKWNRMRGGRRRRRVEFASSGLGKLRRA